MAADGVEEALPAPPVPVLALARVVEAVEAAPAVPLAAVAVRVRPAIEAAHPAEALGFPHPTAAAGMITTILHTASPMAPVGAAVVGVLRGPGCGTRDPAVPRRLPSRSPPKTPNKIPKAKTFGNNRYYAGGARAPYSAGARTSSGISPYFLPVAALAFFPGIWLAGAYAYSYPHGYYYHNNDDNKNETLPVQCLCEQYQECGCDDNNNSTYYESLFNGTQPRNTSVARVVNVNGTKTIVINGTLANGTTADDGTSSSDDSTTSSTSGAAQGPLVTLINASGYWVMVAVVVATVWSV